MEGHFTIRHERDHIHVVLTGSASGSGGEQAATYLWQRIAAACTTHSCYKILGEQHLTQPLAMDAAYQHFSIFAKAGIDSRHKIAWVDSGVASRKVVDFIIDVVSSRLFVRAKSFTDLDVARQWLSEA